MPGNINPVEVSPQLTESMQWEVRLRQAATSLPTTGLLRLLRDGNDSIGNISAGGNIFAGGGILDFQPIPVSRQRATFLRQQVIAGTLTAGGNITIDNSSSRIRRRRPR